jgi:hypothetical protein
MEPNKTFASMQSTWASRDFFQSMKGAIIAIFGLWGSPLLLDRIELTRLPIVTAQQLDSIVLRPCTYGQDEEISGFSPADDSPRYTSSLATLSSCPITSTRLENIRKFARAVHEARSLMD